VPAVADIPGVPELWGRTTGVPEIRIGLLEGAVDLGHEAFAGADLRVIEPTWQAPTEVDEYLHRHGTFITSQIFGRHGGPVPGVAPHCRGLVVPGASGRDDLVDQLSLVRGLDALIDADVHVIHCGLVLPSTSGAHVDLLRRAIATAEQAGILVVAPAGNNYGEVQIWPSTLPTVLAVGANDDDGQMYRFSNYGPLYRDHGIVAPGGNVTGARPGGGTCVEKGTSCSAPVVTGVAGLLLSLQHQHGLPVDPLVVRDALIATATAIPAQQCHGEPERGLSGLLNIPGAVRRILAGVQPRPSGDARVVAVPEQDREGSVTPSIADAGADRERVRLAPPVEQRSGPVFVLGELGHDFPSLPGKLAFAGRMPPVRSGAVRFAARPEDPRQVQDHLRAVPNDSTLPVWTLSQDRAPVYALQAAGSYAGEVYTRLVDLLGHRVAVAARLTDRHAELISGQVLPVIEIEMPRHLHGWSEDELVRAAVAAVPGVQDTPGLREFLARVHHDLRGLGVVAAQRARNYAATDVVQAAEVFARAAAQNLVLDRITVEPSPFGRTDHDCWDVCLSFFDPENCRRSGRVFRITVDVTDVQPVGLGPVHSWS